MTGIYKPLANEVSIATANNVWNASLVRVINPGATGAVLAIASGGTQYANITLLGNCEVIIKKSANDTLQGTGMSAVPVAYLN